MLKYIFSMSLIRTRNKLEWSSRANLSGLAVAYPSETLPCKSLIEDKHSSLICLFDIDKEKQFQNINACNLCYESFFFINNEHSSLFVFCH
jgi:hypothetical protein